LACPRGGDSGSFHIGSEKTILNVNKQGINFQVRTFQAGQQWKARLVLVNHTETWAKAPTVKHWDGTFKAI
jgi:hypothetical protein